MAKRKRDLSRGRPRRTNVPSRSRFYQDKTRAEDRGARDAASGVPRHACPYTAHALRGSWFFGWDHASGTCLDGSRTQEDDP